MDLRRLRAADWATGFFGAALVGLLWAPWFSSFALGGRESLFGGRSISLFFRDANAWQAMSVNDVILFLAGLLGIWVALATAVYSTGAVPIAAATAATFGGLLASLLALIRVIWPPDLGPGPTYLRVGSALGLLAAAGVTVSAAVSMRDERRSPSAEITVTELPAPQVSSA